MFSFGEGLSYASFEYRDLEVQTPVVAAAGTLRVTLYLKNTSSRAGVEVVQLYVRDRFGTVTRPSKELKGFQRVGLEAGEERQVQFELQAAGLGFHGLDGKYVVEPGEFRIWVGPDSTRGLEGKFDLEG